MTQPHHRWDEEPDYLPEKPSAEEVEGVIWSMIYPDHWIRLDEVGRRRMLRTICDENNWPWAQVSRVIRRTTTASMVRKNEPTDIAYTDAGIPVYTERFANPQPICPWRHTFFHMGYWTVLGISQNCHSLSERRCGGHEADRLLYTVQRQIEPLSEIHVAETTYDKDLSNRLGQRRHSRKVDTFTYRDINDDVMVLASGPIGGVAPPQTSEPMPPGEAIQMLRPRLWVPGHRSHSFSDGWKLLSPPPPGHDQSVPLQIALDALTEDQVADFKERADNLRREMGLKIGVQVPPDRLAECREGLLRLRENVLNGL